MGMQTIEERTAGSGHHPVPLQKVETSGESTSYFIASPDRANEEDWKVEESWTAIVGYMAELSLPGEG
jgi:hypothetical protein